jgi:hypothetical protein
MNEVNEMNVKGVGEGGGGAGNKIRKIIYSKGVRFRRQLFEDTGYINVFFQTGEVPKRAPKRGHTELTSQNLIGMFSAEI